MKYFRIIMGIGFLGKLETALVQVGAEIIAAGPGACPTEYRVLAQFPKTIATQHQVAQYLWTKFPGAEVTVQEIGKFATAEAVDWCGGNQAAAAK